MLDKTDISKGMKALVRILLIIPFSLLIGGAVQAQGITGIQDSVAIRQQKAEAENKAKAEAGNKAKVEVEAEAKIQNRAEARTKNQTQARAGENGQVKKVTSARPDMSKAKGARPGSIVRPAGSRLPKGVGRPGGAAGHGRR